MKPRNNLAVEESDGELVVLDKDGGEVHQLNETASLVWRGLSNDLNADEIAVELSNAFEVQRETALSDVNAVIRQFEELGLLEE